VAVKDLESLEATKGLWDNRKTRKCTQTTTQQQTTQISRQTPKHSNSTKQQNTPQPKFAIAIG